LPDKWLEFIQCKIEGYSLRKSSELLRVHYVTLFYWRHKLLSAIKEIDFEKFQGIVETMKRTSYTQKKVNEK
jgi:transposase-like protein